MSSKDRPFIHPFVFFMVNVGVERTHESVMMGATGKGNALKNLLWFLAWFEKDAKEALTTQISFLKKRIQLTPEELEIWDNISTIANVLHEKGYFLAAKMRPPTRETSMKEIELTVDKAKYAKDRKNIS